MANVSCITVSLQLALSSISFLFQRANAAAMLRKWCCILALLTFIPLAFYISIQMDASQGTKVTKI
jgi:hypothetical protein